MAGRFGIIAGQSAAGPMPNVFYPNWDVVAANTTIIDNQLPTNKVLRTAGSAYAGALDSTVILEDFELEYIVQATGENYKQFGMTTSNSNPTANADAEGWFIVSASDVRARVGLSDVASLTITAGDVLKIERIAGVSRWYKNNVLIYRKIPVFTGLVYPYAAPGDPNLYVQGLKITAYPH